MPQHAGKTDSGIDQAQSASIVASSHDAIVGMTRSGRITGCNPAAAALYGASRDIVGRCADDFIPPERRADEAALLQRILNGEKVEQYRTQRLRADGSAVELWMSISPIVDSGGVIVGAATAAREVGALQQSHERFERRADQQRLETVDAAERLDLRADQHRAEAQDAAERYETQVDEERAQARDAAERLEERADQHRSEVDAAAHHYEAHVELERSQARDVADRFEVEVGLERVQAKQAQVQAEGEVLRARQDKEHLQAQLEQSQRLEVLGRLAGGVAHDFNNLLAVILNYAAFVAEELESGAAGDLAAASRDVGQIQRAAQRAGELTHQLLAFARREVVRPQVLNLNEVIAEVRQLLDRTLGEDIVLRTELASALWPVLADAGQIEQVLVNLAVNARDAMSGGGTLTIDTANVTLSAGVIAEGSPLCPGPHVRLRVGDTGTGMAPELVEHVFEPFFTTKADGSGTGLGLATVYGIVSQAGGTVDIRSREGIGTTFTILFPVTNEVAVSLTADGDEPGPGAGAGETILVVEDEEALREVTERILVRGGYRVLTASDGEEAVSMAGSYDGEIDLLVTDVVMPRMLGDEVAEKVLALRPGTEVLYMSGYARPLLAARGRLDRDVHLLDKPFSSCALTTEVGRILHGRTG